MQMANGITDTKYILKNKKNDKAYFINKTQQIQSFSEIKFCRMSVVITDVHLAKSATAATC